MPPGKARFLDTDRPQFREYHLVSREGFAPEERHVWALIDEDGNWEGWPMALLCDESCPYNGEGPDCPKPGPDETALRTIWARGFWREK